MGTKYHSHLLVVTVTDRNARASSPRGELCRALVYLVPPPRAEKHFIVIRKRELSQIQTDSDE